MAWTDYPEAASENAQRALDFKESNGSDCGTAVGWFRARQLTERAEISDDIVKRTFSFLSRAKVYDQGDFVDSDGNQICGSIMYAAWGGDEMREWAEQTIEKMNDTEERPYPGEHAARLIDPEMFDEFRRENDAFGEGIHAIYGIKDGVSELQAIRFDAEKYSVEDAQMWLDENDHDPILFEPALEESAAPMVEEKAAPDELEIGDFVRWKSGNGYAYGRIIEINADGELSSDSGFVVTGTADNPAALIRIYEFNADEGAYMERTPVLNVVHLFATLEKFDAEVRNNVPVMERRSTEFRAELDGEIVRGYAAVFDSPSEDLGGFIEYIMPGAFDDVLNDDVRAFYNHSDSFLLGRVSSGTLRVWQDENGLGYEVKMPNTTYANDLIELMRRGDVNQSSFAFLVGRDRWEKRNGKNVRIIEKVSRLIDVSPVVLPAYPAATSGLAQREHHDGEVERPNLRDFILRITKLEN
jgi:HK97 family phage prohead protease